MDWSKASDEELVAEVQDSECPCCLTTHGRQGEMELARRYLARGDMITQLASFIVDEIEGEPSQSEGAIECAIRIMKEQREEIRRLKENRKELNRCHSETLGVLMDELEDYEAAMREALAQDMGETAAEILRAALEKKP